MLLICSAWQEEIQHLDTQLSISLGIGYLEAALNLEQFLEENRAIDKIIFLGTAGSYSQNIEIGEIVTVDHTALLQALSLKGQAYSPLPYPKFKSNSVEPLLKSAACLSSLEITTDKSLAQEIYNYYSAELETPYLVENMELYGVAKAASQHAIPWSAQLAITNYTDSNAHQDWQDNHLNLSAKLCQQQTQLTNTSS